MEKTGGYYEQNPERKELSRKRLIWVVDEYCNSSQAEFAKKTGLQRSTVSMYTTGKNVLGIRNASKIGQVFGLNRDWLRGDPDAPMYRDNYGSKDFLSGPIFYNSPQYGPIKIEEYGKQQQRENSIFRLAEVMDAYTRSDPATQWAVRKFLGIESDSEEDDSSDR